jgi:hypothetical protein
MGADIARSRYSQDRVFCFSLLLDSLSRKVHSHHTSRKEPLTCLHWDIHFHREKNPNKACNVT